MQVASRALKMEATCLFKMLLDFQWTTPHYIPQERTLRNHKCETLESYRPRFLLKQFQLAMVMLPVEFCGVTHADIL
jgi:hypothetical protein